MSKRLGYARTVVLCGAILVQTGVVWGQALPPDQSSISARTATSGQPEGKAALPVPPADVSSSELQEIVVTALLKDTNLHETSAAVSFLTGDALAAQNVNDLRDAEVLVPAVHFGQEQTATQIFIRGIGSALDFPWISEDVAVNLNGVYVPRYSTGGSFYDLDSLQVLPGPQGVLYGRSAGGGAVLINTARPVVGHEETSAEIEYGNYDFVHVNAMENFPVSDRLAMRAAVDKSYDSGYQSLGDDALNNLSGRLSLLYEATDNLSIYGWATYFQQRGKPESTTYVPYLSSRNPWLVPAVDPVTGDRNDTGSMNMNYWLGGVEAKYTIDPVTLQYNAGILDALEDSSRNVVGAAQEFYQHQKQYTQSVKFSTRSLGPVQIIGGADWYDATTSYTSLFGVNEYGDIFPGIDQRSYSGYLQPTFSITQSLRIVAGARVSVDSLKLAGDSNACFFGTCYLSPINFDHSWWHTDVKLGIEYDLSHDVMLYGNVQTGYVPGTLNTYPDASTFDKEVKPQTLKAYTIGIKSDLGEKFLSVDVEGYYYSYDDLIIQEFNPALGQQTLYNAPRATVYGGQVTSSLRATASDTFTANVGYTHGRYGSFVASPGAPNVDGLQMQYTPDYTATLAYDHRFVLGNHGALDARVASYLSSSWWGTFTHSTDTQQAKYTKTDLFLIYHSPTEHWSVELWVKNIENAAVAADLTASGYPSPPAASYIEPPRTFGISFRVKR